MSNEDNAKRVARFLKMIAARIEERPEFLEGLDLADLPLPTPKKRAAPATPPAIDIMQIFLTGGAEQLRRCLEPLEIKELKAVIGKYGLDPSGLARNWRKPEKLIELILERAEARGRKGEAFRA